MMELIKNTEMFTLLVIVIGSLLGTVKSSAHFDSSDKICTQILNGVIGLFCGIMLGYHFGSTMNVWLTGLIALVGAASASIALEVVLELLPATLSKAIKKYTKKYTE